MGRNNSMALALLCALALSSCATPPDAAIPVDVKPARLAPAPANVMQTQEANFLSRLLSFFSAKPAEPMPSSSN